MVIGGLLLFRGLGRMTPIRTVGMTMASVATRQQNSDTAEKYQG
jgi:hypothetical protein